MKLLNNSCEEALMKDNKSKILKELVERIPALSSCEEDISKAFNVLKECFEMAENSWLQETVVLVPILNISREN